MKFLALDTVAVNMSNPRTGKTWSSKSRTTPLTAPPLSEIVEIIRAKVWMTSDPVKSKT